MIEITKTWDEFKIQQAARTLVINYALNADFYVLYIVSNPFFWICRLDRCIDERITRAALELLEGQEPPDKSQDLVNLEDFENNYLSDALAL